MAQAKITLLGMENYLNPDHSVFEQMVLPEGIDKDVLIGSIILRCQEFELLYSDPDFLTSAINIWSRKNYWTFDKWVKLLDKEYDPLFNKDYYEEIKDIHAGDYKKDTTGTVSGTSSESSDYTRTDDLKAETDITVTHSEAAYNSSSLEEKTEDVTDGEVNNSGTQRNAGTTTGTSSGTNTDKETGNDNYTNTHTYHGYGNIGITSAQELFMREANDVARFNMYEHIADLFCSEFCIMVY